MATRLTSARCHPSVCCRCSKGSACGGPLHEKPARSGAIHRARATWATMGGLQIYLHRDHTFGRGHQILLDSPWGLSSISQGQFWPQRRKHLPRGTGVLSVDISSWDLPGSPGWARGPRLLARTRSSARRWRSCATPLVPRGSRRATSGGTTSTNRWSSGPGAKTPSRPARERRAHPGQSLRRLGPAPRALHRLSPTWRWPATGCAPRPTLPAWRARTRPPGAP